MNQKIVGFALAFCLGGAVVSTVHNLGAQQIPAAATVGFVDNDTACPAWPSNPSGAYMLSQIPWPIASLQVYVNGVRWSLNNDFTVQGATVSLINGQTFASTDKVICGYRTFNVTP